LKVLLKNRKVVLFVVTLQEAFSAIVPYFLLTSFLSLIYLTVSFYHINFNFININNIKLLVNYFQSFSSVVANITIAYFFAKRLKISQIITITLSIATFATILLLEHPSTMIIMPYGFDTSTLFSPIVSAYFLKLFYPRLSLRIPLTDVHHHVYRLLNYIVAFLFAYISTVFLYILFDSVADNTIDYINTTNFNLPNILLFIIRDLAIQIFWFLGLHGSHMVNALFGKEILFKSIMPNLTYAEFNRLFVVIGGAGVGFGLLISLLICAKDKSVRFVTKLSMPFAIFNINDMIIYLIVVFNRYIILPFIFLPIANILIAYLALQTMNVHFTDYYLTWMTPVFVDSFLKVQEYHKTILLQIFLIIFDTSVYIYFVKKYFNSQSATSHFDMLVKNLDITDEIKAEEGLRSFVKRQEIIEANAQLDKIINSINNHDIFVYYQPKIDLRSQTCDKFEALIRYYHDGKLTGPVFLDIVEKAGLAPIIDIYVCKKVKGHIDIWKKEGFYPQISINLHPDTLKSKKSIDKIIEIVKGENIIFEIIERSFLKKSAQDNLSILQQNGFKISIDDFGTGYSSFETLAKYKIDELKMDKSLIDIIEQTKGYLICKNTAKLCHEIKCDVVAEGVETKKQIELVKKINVDFVQGFYYSAAIPFNKVKEFTFSIKKISS